MWAVKNLFPAWNAQIVAYALNDSSRTFWTMTFPVLHGALSQVLPPLLVSATLTSPTPPSPSSSSVYILCGNPLQAPLGPMDEISVYHMCQSPMERISFVPLDPVSDYAYTEYLNTRLCVD